jgi:uncharacterized hydrophobic protein (TIGR00271 family)
MSTHADEFVGELRLGWRLTGRGQVAAIGLGIAVGLFFLLAGPAMALAGAWSAVGSLLAGVLMGLTCLSVWELLGGSSERGGTYTLIHETLTGWGAFIAGWSILSGGLVVIALLTQSAADHVLLLLGSVPIPRLAIGLGLLLVLVLVQLFQLLPRRSLLWPLTLVLLVALAVVVVSVLPAANVHRAVGTEVGPRTVLRTAAWIAMAYAALEAILSSRRQVRDPERHLPAALITVLVVVGLGMAILVLVAVLVGPGAAQADSALAVAQDGPLAAILGLASPLPQWISAALGLLASLVATSGCLLVAARQMRSMAQEGGLPRVLSRLRRPFALPPLAYALVLGVAAVLAYFVPGRLLLDLAAALFLVPMIMLNVAALRSHQMEPGRRRLFVAPFYPLVPSVAIALSLALLGSLPLSGLLAGTLWLGLGLVVYVTYARRREREAREGVSVFGAARPGERREGLFRILVPLAGAAERHLALHVAVALARQVDGEVIPLQVIAVPDPLAIEEGRRLASEQNVLFRWSTRMGQDSGVETYPITRLARSVAQGIVDTATEEECDLILMPWAEKARSPGARLGSIVSAVVREAPCDVAVVVFDPPSGSASQKGQGEAPFALSRILVPTAGGPHAPLATGLAVALARELQATVTAVYVTPLQPSTADIEQAEERIQATLQAMQHDAASLRRQGSEEPPQEGMHIESKIVAASSVVRGIAEAGKEYDLVFIGASDERLIDQVLFGTVPEQIAMSCPSPVVMVKRYRGLPRFWLQRLWAALFRSLPTLSREEQTDVNQRLRAGAQPDVDFFVMMVLSTLIASLGLLQSSTAVIIGAMLVAPLFTPILAMSVGIVQGHVRLLRMAIEAIVKGIVLAIGAAVLFTALSPLHPVTPEILARTRPNLFDLAVALASGAAGAYAVARKDVASSLPGVAIAAALVPPLATVGIGLATGSLAIASGALLLFVTNLTAIVLAGAVTMLLLGFRPAPRQEQEARVRTGLVVAVVLLVLITIPLTVVFVDAVSTSRAEQAIRQTLTRQLEAIPEADLVGFTFDEQRDEVLVHVTLYAARSLTRAEGEQLSAELSKALGKPARLHLVTVPVMEIDVAPR